MDQCDSQGEKKNDAACNVKTEHHCSVCGKLNPATICHACEDKVRAEAAERKRDIERK